MILSPLEHFEKIYRKEKYAFFLDSVKPGKNARYSYIFTLPFLIFKSKKNRIEIIENRKKKVFWVGDLLDNPIEELRKIFKEKKEKGTGPFLIGDLSGGAVGYFGYECKNYFEKLPQNTYDDLNLPDIYLTFCDKVIVYDQYKERRRKMEDGRQPSRFAYGEKLEVRNRIKLKSNITKEEFIKMVKRAKEYIKAGDIYQANLSQRFETNFSGDPFELYKNLREINPSPFSCFLSFPEFKVVSCSPELLLRLRGKSVETRPIAGTRPRGNTKSHDKKLSTELLLDPKERAEHIMLVDLERNDLGRVCKYGSVRVSEKMVLEKYSHVIHIVSNVVGTLKNGKDRFDLLKATFPGGTITGCPKIRCMEIIDELEPTARGPYTGSAGWLDFKGDMDLNILIRTIIVKDKKAYFQVGAGIVADSNPEREYFETLHKAEALIEAIKRIN